MEQTEIKVGDRVGIFCYNGWGNSDLPIGVQRVTRVMKKFVELSNNTKWDHYGNPYPRYHGRGSNSSRITKLTPAMVISIRQGMYKRKLWHFCDVAWSTLEVKAVREALTVNQLLMIATVLRESLTEKQYDGKIPIQKEKDTDEADLQEEGV